MIPIDLMEGLKMNTDRRKHGTALVFTEEMFKYLFGIPQEVDMAFSINEYKDQVVFKFRYYGPEPITFEFLGTPLTLHRMAEGQEYAVTSLNIASMKKIILASDE